MSSEFSGGNAFMTTPWTDILSIEGLSASEKRKRLDFLLGRYWQPVYFFIRRKGRNAEEARDLTQAFFAKIIETDMFRLLDPERGRLRSYLLTSVARFINSPEGYRASGKSTLQEKGKYVSQLSIEPEESSFDNSSPSLSAEEEFNRQWAITLLNTVFDKLYEMCQSRNTPETFKVFEKRMKDHDQAYGANREIAAELGITVRDVEAHFKKALRWYRYLMREEIAAYVEDPSEIEDEIRDLWKILSG